MLSRLTYIGHVVNDFFSPLNVVILVFFLQVFKFFLEKAGDKSEENGKKKGTIYF